MSESKSKSSSSSTTQSTNEDNRVVAENEGIAVGKDGIYNYSPTVNNELSDNMLAALDKFVDLVRDAGEVVVKTTDQTNEQAKATVSAVTNAIAADKAGTTKTFSDMIPLIIGAVVVIVVFGMIFKKKE